jgi:Thiamine biosynthesis enzyme ThiH and related uncharacterized enzymes
MAGATTPQQQTIAALEHAIREAGREPVQRDSHYRYISPVGRETHDTSASGTRLRVNDRARIVGRLCQTPDCLGVSQKHPTNILYVEIRPRRLR